MDININKEKGTIEVLNKIGFKVIFAKLGASIYSIEYKGKQITLTPNFEDFKKTGLYHGKTIGRVGNRIKGNKIVCDNKEYIIENNEGDNTLHGGINGISSKNFDYLINEEKDYTEVIFSYLSPDLESGFPGNLAIKVIYKIFENTAKIKLNLKANTDKETLCSLTNHAFFMLGEEDETNLKLTIKASTYILPRKEDLIGICREKVPNYLDFKDGRMIMKDINHPVLMDGKTQGYDHHFFFDKVGINEENIILESKKIRMKIFTDYSGCQIYTDNYPDNIKFLNTDKTIRRGIAIEPQESHLDLHYLRPGENYNHTIIYLFEEI